VIVGVGQWERYTKPLLDSIKAHMPDMGVVCVDNGSHYPDYEGVQMVRTPNVLCYAGGLNEGLQHAPHADWYLILNNDIIIERPFTTKGFSPSKLYGFIRYPFKRFWYLAGWGMFISYEALQDVGWFDDNLKPMWFEDADYCIRAQKAGYEIVVLDREDYGIRHYEDENMGERKAYMGKHMKQRILNRQYVERKHGM
jgi:GT2 family glycosyltransferase